ncbi:MAG: hypothetical protein AB7O86_12290 [Porticoccaceae bacterium]
MKVVKAIFDFVAAKPAIAGLAVSLALNVGLVLYVDYLQVKAELATEQKQTAIDANATGVAAVNAAVKAAEECAGQKADLEAETKMALEARAKAERSAAAARAARARAVGEAMQDADCAANARTPVCPGLVGGR